jgi:hypothetical protein
LFASISMSVVFAFDVLSVFVFILIGRIIKGDSNCLHCSLSNASVFADTVSIALVREGVGEWGEPGMGEFIHGGTYEHRQHYAVTYPQHRT